MEDIFKSVTNQIHLSLGSNLGQRQKNLQRAIDALGEVMAVEAISSIYETAPWGFIEQPDFLNICISGKTFLRPDQFLSASKEIEEKVGRQPSRHWGPRLIDIDLLYYERLVIHEEELTIPHPGLTERAFVLKPLAEIAEKFIDPQLNISVAELAQSIDDRAVKLLQDPLGTLRRPVHFSWGIKTYVMGIINVTPDSFSGDGLSNQDEWIKKARDQAISFVDHGADILDVGGESTRPGSSPISAEEEMRRIVPVITAIRRLVNVPISIDTYRATVAKAALTAGADWINDVWGLRMDQEMAAFVGKRGCPIVIMHNRSKPKDVEQETRLGGRYVGVKYDDLISDIRQELQGSIDIALNQGVDKNRIILDPGLGFGKTVKQNLRLLDRLDSLKDLGFPLLVGPSRKSFIGFSLNLPPDERVEGTAATVAIAIDRGADIIRVHDVKEMARVAGMTDRIVRSDLYLNDSI
jgi:dihydropteroate synthase/2-amino-4-hydroxy-6-hydroxymethyldihydropteridine diphosphokinase